MDVRVLLFGPQAAAAGCETISVSLPPGATCADLRGVLGDKLPVLLPSLKESRIALNSEFAADSTRIGAGDEVALIGLVSGG